jgi:general stress protein 26
MKKINKSIYLTFTILLLIPSLSFGQKSEGLDSAKIKIMKAAREIMTSVKTCALITLDQEGRPAVRAMEPFPPESDFTVWFGTNPNSRKVAQIKEDPRITLYYLASAVSSDICLVEVDCSLSLIEAEVHDFSELKEWFCNEEKAQNTSRSPDRLSLTQH